MSRPWNIDRADQIGVFLEAAFDAEELRLRLPVVRRDMITARASTARVLRRHGNEPASMPRQLVVQLAAKLGPALIEDGFVQAGPNPQFSRG